MKFTIDDFLKKFPLPADEKWKECVFSTEIFTKGDFELKLFAPRGEDYQTPHEKDEIYIIASGRGEFVKETERINFETGDVLFVEAKVPHRFENFTDDLVAWVIFF